MLPFVLISLFTFFFIHFPIYSETAGNKVFCGPALDGIPNPCNDPLLLKPGMTLTEETVEGTKVCCGFDKLVSGYTPGGKREEAGLRRRPSRNAKLDCKAALTFTISNGNLVSGCPSKTFYDQGKDQCCRYVKAANDEGKNGTSGNCVDLAAPGRASDCPQNKDRCDDPLWRDLMTEQCPKTCGRCGKKAKSDSKRGDSIACRDGIGPNGVSECPQNKNLCDDPDWKELMQKECPKTCNVCGGTNNRRRTRTRGTTKSPPSGK